MRLEPVNSKNWRTDVRVAESQRHYVADKATLLARAYAYRAENSQAYFLYEGETAVGMGLYYDCPELDAYDFSQFFIDQRYQGRGLGLAGAKLLLEEMRREGKYKKVFFMLHPGKRRCPGVIRETGLYAHRRAGRRRNRHGKKLIDNRKGSPGNLLQESPFR